MNDAHLHLVVNHLPILGTIFGLGILIAGLFFKNNSVKNTAYILFVIAAVFAAFSMGTGEGAEELVEDMPNIGHEIIHEHEELAEKFALVMYVLGVFSLLSLFASYKNSKYATAGSYITFILAVIAVILSVNVGISGAEVRHTEVRQDSLNSMFKGNDETINRNSDSVEQSIKSDDE